MDNDCIDARAVLRARVCAFELRAHACVFELRARACVFELHMDNECTDVHVTPCTVRSEGGMMAQTFITIST